MATIVLPDTAFSDAQWTLVVPAQVNTSEWTGRRQVMRLPGATRWRVSAPHVPIIGEANFRPWRAFLAELQGSVNTFRMPATEGSQRQIAGIVTTSASAAIGATALALASPVAGWVLSKGMMATIVVGAREQLVTVKAGTVGNGSVTIDPPLRFAVPSATPVEYRNPWALVALDASETSWSVDRGQIYSFALSASEVG